MSLQVSLQMYYLYRGGLGPNPFSIGPTWGYLEPKGQRRKCKVSTKSQTYEFKHRNPVYLMFGYFGTLDCQKALFGLGILSTL